MSLYSSTRLELTQDHEPSGYAMSSKQVNIILAKYIITNL